MFDETLINSIFKELTTKGYILFLSKQYFFLMNKELGIVIKIKCIEQSKMIEACIIQTEPNQFSSEENINTLNEFPFEFDFKSEISGSDNLSESLINLKQQLLITNSNRLFGIALLDVINVEYSVLLQTFNFKIFNQNSGVMSEAVYLYNKDLLLKISRNYYDWHLRCVVCKYNLENSTLNITEVIPLELLLDEQELHIATTGDLSDKGQQKYLDELFGHFIKHKEFVIGMSKNNSVNWQLVSGPRYLIHLDACWF